MKNTIHRYRKLIWIWTVLCLIGLAGGLYAADGTAHDVGNWRISILNNDKRPENSFWPMVEFITQDQGIYNPDTRQWRYQTKNFGGFFCGFDIADGSSQ